MGNHAVIDEWIKYLKDNTEVERPNKIIDECDCEEKMNAVHVAVFMNDVQTLKKLVDAGASMYILLYLHEVPMYLCK